MAEKCKVGQVYKTTREELPYGTAPDCLVWELVKKNNSHLFKSGHETFSRERHNIMARNTPVFSGLRQKSVMNVELAPSGNKIYLRNMNLQNVRRPRSRSHVKKFSKSISHTEALNKFANHSRPELAHLLVQKFIKLTHAKTDEKSD
ncbi:60S ribosomal protein L28, putative [Babesia ovis]|uniref:60S ribosomal protein L28, putative n=1 Tax=Babesia ovis TaxID=5869 RepID=A0A9W5TBW3_BABOV|nr:60S ribosomal protein L28, putative [Babesia ovis]